MWGLPRRCRIDWETRLPPIFQASQQANRELSPKGIDKGVGVARALAYLGREGNARTFGFGDSGNDLGMLAAVETAVAMGNAMPEVKAVADYVTDDVAHDGTVTAMRHFGLIE